MTATMKERIIKTEEIEMFDEESQEHPIVEREFETDDKGRNMVVCILCGEIRPYKTKGEGRCCMRTTHKWRPIAKKPGVGTENPR